MSDLSRKMFLAETAAVREHLAEQEQQATAKAEAALAPLKAKASELEARRLAEHQPAAGARQDEVWPVKEDTRRYAAELRAAPGQAAADGHTGWDCGAGAQLLVSATTPGPGALGTHHGTIYACPVHQGAALQRITGAGYEADPQPAPPGHRWNPWPCGHVTAHDRDALTALTAAGARQDGDQQP
ncbi:hypothetical protein ACPCK1_02750 [Streptomyces pseudogriseolus]|uniref:hypothetical protein n=1 Tax=Streptomyces pseudogriseolus TaxID=36817 RepID=UPI003FA214D4